MVVLEVDLQDINAVRTLALESGHYQGPNVHKTLKTAEHRRTPQNTAKHHRTLQNTIENTAGHPVWITRARRKRFRRK